MKVKIFLSFIFLTIKLRLLLIVDTKCANLKAFPKPVQHPHPPLFMGGGGKKLLTLAGREADIVGLHLKINDDGTVDASVRTEAALAQKVEWVRQAAGARFVTIELNLLLSGVIITEDQEQAVQQYIRERDLPGVTVEQLLASPYLLIGTIEQLAERIQHWREQLGISYLVVRHDDMERFAPVVARLAGA